MTSLDETRALRLLLVRAAEEKAPSLFSVADTSDAALAALDARDDVELLDRRSDWLARRLPRSLDALARTVAGPRERVGPLLAASMLLGLAGTYLRGLFFEYDAVWRSTFLVDPASVATFLNVLLGPAGLLLDGGLLDAATVAPLLTPEGDAAGPWIHRLALTSLLVIAVPRLLLAVASTRREVSASACTM